MQILCKGIVSCLGASRQPDELIRSGDVSLVFVQYAILFSYAGSEVNHKWPPWTDDGADSDDGVKGESDELDTI